MSHRRRSMIMCFIWTAAFAWTQLCFADDKQLFDEVRTLYGAARGAITSVECTYWYDIGDATRECRYARNGTRYYHAGVLMTPGGALSMPTEIAWDGQKAYMRTRLNLLARSGDLRRAKTACPAPEVAFNYYLDQAYGFDPVPNRRYTLVSAKRTHRDDGAYVEVKFAVEWKQGATLTVLHSEQKGYWPVDAILANKDGSIINHLTNVRLASIERDGNKLFYPVQFSRISHPGTGMAQESSVRVDEKTLQVNMPIDASRFVLQRWPSEELQDFDSHEHLPPQDPKWDPEGHVGFPFAAFSASINANKAKLALASPKTGYNTQQQAAGPLNHTPPPRDVLDLAGIYLPIAGCVCGGLGGVWFLKRRLKRHA